MKHMCGAAFRLLKRSALLRICVFLIMVCGLVLVAGCAMIWMPGKSHSGALPQLDAAQTALRDALQTDLEKLAGEIGERNVFKYENMNAAADFIETSFAEAGHEVTRQPYEADKRTFYNIQAELPGTDRRDEIVVVGAHYDSVPGAPGANDNGTGMVAVMAIARAFSGRRASRTLRFVAFANEEPPYFQTPRMGSWVYAKSCRERDENIVAMFTPETIGYFDDNPGSQKYPWPFRLFYPSTGNFVAFVGNYSSRKCIRKSIAAFRKGVSFPSEGAALPEFIPAAGLSDHWAFWQEGYPGFMVTDTAFYRYRHYHTSEDTVDKIDFDRLARVVDGLTRVVEAHAEQDDY